MWFLASACAIAPTVIDDLRLSGRTVSLHLDDGRIVEVCEGRCTGVDGTVLAGRGRHLVPGFIDTHVHFAFQPGQQAMLDGGVVAAVDWAAPLDSPPETALPVLRSGPMITAPGGYPTQSWGADGYGLETPASDVEAAVDRLAAFDLIKVPLTSGPRYDGPTLTRLVNRAHAAGKKVGVHALGDADALQACLAGADVLVHVPVETLTPPTLTACRAVAVIPTLSAFGARAEAVENTRRLREAGATVLYGTDYGNAPTAGISEPELRAMQAAGMDGEAILAAGTTTPRAWFGFPTALVPGSEASFLLLDGDPLLDPLALVGPREVWVKGRRR